MCMYLFLECHDGSPRSLSRSQGLLFTRCCLSHHFHICHHPLNIRSFCMRNASNPGAPTERSVSSICLVLTGRSGLSGAHTELTCHQNTVLGFSTMGPGRVPCLGWPRLEPPALHTEHYEVTTGGSHVSPCHCS